MTTEVLLKLLDAGYSKDEISLMEEVEAKPTGSADENMPEPEAAPAPVEVTVTKEIENPSEKMTETINDIMQIITKMQKTLDGMQQKNAKTADSGQPERLTADDVVRNFFGKDKKA